MRKSANEMEVTSIVKNGQLEWSSNTINIVQSFFSSLQRSRSYSGEIIPPTSLPRADRPSMKLPWKFPTDIETTVNFEASNINVFIANNYKGEKSLYCDETVIYIHVQCSYSTVDVVMLWKFIKLYFLVFLWKGIPGTCTCTLPFKYMLQCYYVTHFFCTSIYTWFMIFWNFYMISLWTNDWYIVWSLTPHQQYFSHLMVFMN